MKIFQENSLFGLRDDKGKIMITPQYREFYPFSCGVACVRDVNFNYAYIDSNNRLIVPFGKYIWIDPYFTCGYARVKCSTKKDNKEYWGVINTMGELVIPLEYDSIWAIKEEYISSLKASKDRVEHRINLREIDKEFVLDGLKYIKTYTIDEFKVDFNIEKIFVKMNRASKRISFYYGVNIGIVCGDDFLDNPVISIVCNSAGKITSLLHSKKYVGQERMTQAYGT